jgi:hypothetical protein
MLVYGNDEEENQDWGDSDFPGHDAENQAFKIEAATGVNDIDPCEIEDDILDELDDESSSLNSPSGPRYFNYLSSGQSEVRRLLSYSSLSKHLFKPNQRLPPNAHHKATSFTELIRLFADSRWNDVFTRLF